MNIYTPASDRFVHYTYADFTGRLVPRPVHLVQYDNSLPIIAVTLFNDGQPYRLPENAGANIRWHKRDNNIVYNPALGCDASRGVVYFEITQQMTVLEGTTEPVVEIMIGNTQIAASGSFKVIIDKNPVSNDELSSSTEAKAIYEYVIQAENAAFRSNESAQGASHSEGNALTYMTAAKDSENKALASEQAAKISEDNAKESENKALASEQAAKVSETNAKISEDNALASEQAAKNSEEAAAISENNASVSEVAAKTSETNAQAYAQAAAESEANAKSSEEAALLSETNAKTSEENSKASEEAAAESEANAKASEDAAKEYADSIEGEYLEAEAWAVGTKHGIPVDPSEPQSGNSAKDWAAKAAAVAKIDTATTEKAGIVKPDGTTITVDPDGTIHGATSLPEGVISNNFYTQKIEELNTALEENPGGGGEPLPADTINNTRFSSKMDDLKSAIAEGTGVNVAEEVKQKLGDLSNIPGDGTVGGAIEELNDLAGFTGIGGLDLNAFLKGVAYVTLGGSSNLPESTGGMVLACCRSDSTLANITFCCQIFMSVNTAKIYARKCANNVWSNWHELLSQTS